MGKRWTTALLRAPAWALTHGLLALIVAYRWLLSPVLGNVCRFTPSCSQYAEQSLRQHGLIKGLGKTTWRLLRCHPFCQGGHDPP